MPPLAHHRAYGSVPRRFGGLSTRQLFHGKQTQATEAGFGEGAMQRFREAQPPRSLWAEDSRTGRPFGDLEPPELAIALTARLPLDRLLPRNSEPEARCSIESQVRTDSPLEGKGFEPSVPRDRDDLRATTGRYRHTNPKAPGSPMGGAFDRGVASQRVMCAKRSRCHVGANIDDRPVPHRERRRERFGERSQMPAVDG